MFSYVYANQIFWEIFMFLNSLYETKPSVTFSKKKLKVTQSSDNKSNKTGHENINGQHSLRKS